MRTYSDARLMAKALRAALAEDNIDISHSRALEIVAGQFGRDSWNVLAADIDAGETDAEIRFTETAPIMRILDEDRAREFYVDFLGFSLDWEHRFGDNFPLYAQVSRGGLILHLSGHHGDGTPGTTIFVAMQGVRAWQRELAEKDYRHMKPGVVDEPWGAVMTVIDPFSNAIRFCERPGT